MVCRTFLYIRTTGFTTKTGHRQKNLGSLIQKSRETAARTGPNRMVGAFHHTNDECQDSIRSEFLHTALHNTEIVPSNQQTLHAWLLTTLPPTVQTPCKHSIAFPNASLAVTRASDATIMLPAPSDHHMRGLLQPSKASPRPSAPDCWWLLRSSELSAASSDEMRDLSQWMSPARMAHRSAV